MGRPRRLAPPHRPMASLGYWPGIGLAAVLLAGCASAVGPASPAPGTSSSASAPGSATSAPIPTVPGTPLPGPAGTPSPLGDHLVARLDVDAKPCAVAAGPATDTAALWITSYATGTLDRVDPETNRVVDRIDIGGSPCGIGISEDGTVWVADLQGRVIGVDPATRKVVRELTGVGPQLWDLKTAFGSVWAVDRTRRQVVRIDPATGAIVATIPVGRLGSGLGVTKGAVWVADDSDGTIRRIDPTTNAATVTGSVAGGATWFADDRGSDLVVASHKGRQATILDAAGAPSIAIGGWNGPLDGTVAGDTVWLPDGAARTVGTFDAGTGAWKASYALDGSRNPFVAEAVGGDVWVLDFASTGVWRIRP